MRASGLARRGDAGAGLLRSLDGFMVTCGLDHVRGAAEGSAAHFGARRGMQRYPLHGRISQTPARLIGYGEAWTGDECTLWCGGVVRQAMLYGEVLELHRRIEVPLGGTRLVIRDRVANLGHRPTPNVQLYHVNFGFPLLDADTELRLPGAPEVEAALHGAAPPPCEAGDELHDMPAVEAGAGEARAAILNRRLAGGIGVELAWSAATLPRLQVWRNLSPGMHVLAIEPATNQAAKRDMLEAAGAIRYLDPGQVIEHWLGIEVLQGAAALARLDTRMAT